MSLSPLISTKRVFISQTFPTFWTKLISKRLSISMETSLKSNSQNNMMVRPRDSDLSHSKKINKPWEPSQNLTPKYSSEESFGLNQRLKMSVKSLEMENKPISNKRSRKSILNQKMKSLHIRKRRKEKWDRNSTILPIGTLFSWTPTLFLRE